MAGKEEIRRLLDDPHVTDETKRRLLLDYAGAGASLEELAPFERELGVDPGSSYFIAQTPFRVFSNEDEHVAAAQRERDLGSSWSDLTDGTLSPSSDVILDDGVVGLRIFDEFYPRFTRAGGDSGGVRPGADVGTAALDPDSLRASVDELRGIDFTAFTADASSMDAVVVGVDESRNVLAQAWANNLSGWTGGAAEAANQYKVKFDGAVATLDQGIRPIPGAITTASNTIQTQVTDYAKLLHNQWGDGRMAEMTPEQVDAALDGVDELPGVISELEAKIEELNNRGLVDRFVDFAVGALGFLAFGPIGAIVSITGLHFAEEITEDNIEEETQKYRQALTGCQEKVQQFVTDYSTRASSVHEQTQAACQSVQETYDALFAATTGQGKLAANPFEALGTTPDFEDAGQSAGSGGNGSGGGGNGSGGGSGSGSGGGGGSVPVNTGGGGSGGYSPPPLPPTSTDPAQADPGATDPALAGGGSRTPSGSPGDAATDPRGTGAGMPGIPVGGGGAGAGGGSGLPGAPGSAGAPKEVTIKDGNRTITVGEPDARGRSRITVDDGTGKPKTYEMDFGDAMDALGGETGQLGGDLGAEVVQAGPDGKAVIRDGDATITAERVPGNPDQLKLTVDDGTPPPSTYTVDFDTESPGSSQPSRPGGDPGGAASGFGGTGGSAAGGGGSTGGGGSAGGGGGGAAGGGGGGGGGDEEAGERPRRLAEGTATGAQVPTDTDDRTAAASTGGGGASEGAGRQTGGAMGGMPMGGMGAGQGGGDQSRTSKWRTQGQLFDDDDPAANFNGIVGEDPANRPRPATRT